MRALNWLVRAFVFFTLFAFALNNQQEVAVRWFFGFEWHTPMVIVVLAAFAAGCAIGVLAMVPSWWRQRRVAKLAAPVGSVQATVVPSTQVSSTFGAEAAVPREGL
ncbi:MAG: LapA family protein [Burkholderiaceae bacterium]|nr:LapA family protein [Burkholderiaceae bacterium]